MLCVVLCCVLCCVVLCCVVLCCAVLCVVVCCVLGPSSSSVVVVLRPSVRPVRPSPSSVVVLCPSVPSVRPVRPSSSPTCESKAACKFSKKSRNRGREYEIRIELEIWRWIAGGKLLCVLKMRVLRLKHFCFRILAPMSILTWCKTFS